jgi:NAD(P)-dependent dehydrogenase (short-subunit alcohol dehydrogenase family)
MNIEGKVALITGGAHRVGKAITMELAQKGADVIINYNQSKDMALTTAQEAETLGVRAITKKANVANREEVSTMISESEELLGPIQILINSASFFAKTKLPTDTTKDWDQVINTLIHGSFNCSNSVAPMMQEASAGVIINIVDLMAWIPRPGYAAHSVGKAALMALTRQMAVDLAPNIRVNAVAPGPVLSPEHYSKETRDRIASRTLLQRWGTPTDVSHSVIFLIESDYITGEHITVDGGERYGGNQ